MFSFMLLHASWGHPPTSSLTAGASSLKHIMVHRANSGYHCVHWV